MDDEPEMVTCGECDLSFYVIANNDASIMAGEKFQNYCPRCGSELEES